MAALKIVPICGEEMAEIDMKKKAVSFGETAFQWLYWPQMKGKRMRDKASGG